MFDQFQKVCFVVISGEDCPGMDVQVFRGVVVRESNAKADTYIVSDGQNQYTVHESRISADAEGLGKVIKLKTSQYMDEFIAKTRTVADTIADFINESNA